MPLKRYTIELKVDCDEETHEAVVAVARQYACDLLASSVLIAKDQVAIAVMGDDCFYGHEDIMTLVPSGNLHTPDETQ